MDYIQLLVLAAALIVLGRLLILLNAREISLRRFFVWAIFWVLLVLLVFYPELSDKAAAFLGIDRGTDAAFFGAILLVFYLLFKIFMRLERMEGNITKLVRELALRNSENDPKKS